MENRRSVELPKRSEVPLEDTWAIEDMYASVKDWEKDIRESKELAQEAQNRKQEMTADGSHLWETLNLYAQCLRKIELAASYAGRVADTDAKNAAGQENLQKIMSIAVELETKLSFMDPMILELTPERLADFYREEAGLEEYRLYIEELARRKAHRLNAQMEELLAAAKEIRSTPGTVFGMFSNGDLQFPTITDETGETVRLTHGRYSALLNSKERRVRKEAFLGVYQTYGKFRNTLGVLYNGQVRQLMFEAKARKYASTLEASLDVSNVPTAVYDSLIEVVNENLDKLHRYVALRKKVLGLDELHMYDLYVPIVADVDKKFSFEEAKAIVLKALEPMGEEYCALLRQGFERRWIDVYENEGKRSGAYSAGVYGIHPYVLMNYNGSLNDVFTLAHEMGHALHSWFSNRTQPFLYSQYKIFVAEVASTCNEILLIQYLLNRNQAKQAQPVEGQAAAEEAGAEKARISERAYLINRFLENFKATVYRQTMFAEFEKTTHSMAERGEALTAESLSKAYYELNVKYYGPQIVSDEEIALEWARIPHFYMNFYVYQYATGFSAAVALAHRILTEGETALSAYREFLSGGCTRPPVELLKIAGVDMSSKEPVREALRVFGELLDEMERLTEGSEP
ncbi:MAG: oligoendopeptidase F [Clostridium sp.]|nr:oligoendopeptidase F [Clostridium sp.]